MSYPLNNKGKICGGREGGIVIFTRLNFYNEPKIDLCFAKLCGYVKILAGKFNHES